MKWLSLAICSLGVWVFLSAFVSADWVSWVFGGLTAVLAFLAAFMKE